MSPDRAPAARYEDGSGRVGPAGSAAPAEPPAASEPKRTASWLGKSGLDRFSGVYGLILIIAVFSLLEPSLFPTISNLRFVVTNQAISLIAALALVLPVAAGVFDLSIGGTMTLCVTLEGWLQATVHVNAVLATVAVLAVGAVIGVVNGYVVVHLRVSSFIATLGMSSILVAFAYKVQNGIPISAGISSVFQKFGQSEVFGVPVPVFYLIGLCLILWYVLEFSPVGRVIRAVGGNREAARMTGIRVNRYVFGTFIVSGVIAAIAGVVFIAELGNAPIDPGSSYLLPAYSAVFLGSTQLQRGRINVWGTVIALYLLAAGTSGLQLKFPNNPWIQGMFEGFALVIAVALSARSAHKRAAERV